MSEQSDWNVGISAMEKDSFQTSLRRVDEKPPIRWNVFLFQTLKGPLLSCQKAKGPYAVKNVFKALFFVG
jgi:hypothetical protein